MARLRFAPSSRASEPLFPLLAGSCGCAVPLGLEEEYVVIEKADPETRQMNFNLPAEMG